MCGSQSGAHDEQTEGHPQQQPAQKHRCLDAVSQWLNIARRAQLLRGGVVAFAADAADWPFVTHRAATLHATKANARRVASKRVALVGVGSRECLTRPEVAIGAVEHASLTVHPSVRLALVARLTAWQARARAPRRVEGGQARQALCSVGLEVLPGLTAAGDAIS